jgi:hypothetical protein
VRVRVERGGSLLALTTGVLVLAGCGSVGDGSASHSSRSGSPSRGGSSSHTSALPVAADGTDLTACADGRCEVRVGGPASIPVPHGLGVSSVRVRSIGSDDVTVVGRFTGNRQSGFCTGRSCSSSGSGDGFTLTLGADSTGSENGLSITVVTVGGGSAVLRLAPVPNG